MSGMGDMKAEEQRATYTATQASALAEWPIVPFEQVATPQSDRGKRIKQRDYLPEGRIPVIDQGQTLIGGYTNDEDFAFLGELPVVLFGDHTRAVKLVDHRFAVGADGIKIFRPAEGVRPKYLYYWMKSARIPDRGYGRHYQYLRQLTVPLPPPTKQDEIVAEIEKQFSRLDEAVANLKRVKANLKRYKAAVLKAAVEGRLVETEAERARREGRSYETGAQLLQHILETRRSQWKGKRKYKEPVPPDTTDLPELPEGWVWANLESAADRVTVGHVGSMKDEYVEEGVPFLRSQNVRANRYDPEGLKFVSEKFHRQLGKSSLKPGDIVVVRSGSVGVTCVIPDHLSEANCSDLVIIKTPRAVLPDFGAYYMNSVVETRVAAGKVGIALTHFNTQSVAELPLPIPPMAEQHCIVAEVDRRLSLLRETETQADANLQRAARLRQSILSRAFVGGLATSIEVKNSHEEIIDV